MSLIKDADGGLKVISMSDLIRYPHFENMISKEFPVTDKKGRTKRYTGEEAMLYAMGLDVTLPYEVECLTHRSELTNLVVDCERFVGSKRQDDEWLNIEYVMANN